MMNKEEAISRTKFLKTIGLNGAALFAATYCTGVLSSCTNEGSGTSPNGITVDITSNPKLNSNGGYIIVNNNIVLAKTSLGTFVAVPLTCSHEGRKEVMYRNGEFYCTAHGARFDNAGKGLNSEGRGGLKLYTVTQTGTVLTIK
jgi:cytochrome b6-f complex iron-sulfur subunit